MTYVFYSSVAPTTLPTESTALTTSTTTTTATTTTSTTTTSTTTSTTTDVTTTTTADPKESQFANCENIKVETDLSTEAAKIFGGVYHKLAEGSFYQPDNYDRVYTDRDRLLTLVAEEEQLGRVADGSGDMWSLSKFEYGIGLAWGSGPLLTWTVQEISNGKS